MGKATSRFFIGIGNDNQPVTTKITSINFARLLKRATGEKGERGEKKSERGKKKRWYNLLILTALTPLTAVREGLEPPRGS